MFIVKLLCNIEILDLYIFKMSKLFVLYWYGFDICLEVGYVKL